MQIFTSYTFSERYILYQTCLYHNIIPYLKFRVTGRSNLYLYLIFLKLQERRKTFTNIHSINTKPRSTVDATYL